MTMILTCLTPDFVVQASDRRLTYWRGKKFVDKEDDRNKALIYENHTVFAYTGFATLSDHKFAIDWAAEILAQRQTFEDALAYLSDRAMQLMRTYPYSGYSDNQKRLAFVGGGFIHWVEGEMIVRRPAYFIISNFMDHEGKPQRSLYNRFRVFINWPLPIDDPTFRLFRDGQPLEENGEEKLKRTLRRYFQVKQNRVRPEAIGRLLTCAIQETAGVNKKVGKNVICTFVPRNFKEFVEGSGEFHAGGIMLRPLVVSEKPQQLTPPEHLSNQERFMMPPLLDVPRCLYIPGDSDTLPFYKAVHVYPGRIIPEACISEMALTIPPVKSVGGEEMEITAGEWLASLTTKFIEERWKPK